MREQRKQNARYKCKSMLKICGDFFFLSHLCNAFLVFVLYSIWRYKEYVALSPVVRVSFQYYGLFSFHDPITSCRFVLHGTHQIMGKRPPHSLRIDWFVSHGYQCSTLHHIDSPLCPCSHLNRPSTNPLYFVCFIKLLSRQNELHCTNREDPCVGREGIHMVVPTFCPQSVHMNAQNQMIILLLWDEWRKQKIRFNAVF